MFMRLMTWCLAIAVLFVFLAPPAFAEEEKWNMVGLRAGTGDDRSNESFSQYEAYVTYTLPWRWESTTDWLTGSFIGVNAGYVTCEGGAFVGSVGLGVYLMAPGRRGGLAAGIYPTYLGESIFGRDDFGGSFQFTSALDLKYFLNKSMTIGYRFQHMSNAGTSDKNPGLNTHMIELGYRF